MKRDAESSGGALVQGTLDMLLLRVLALEPMHGYGVTQRIQDISRGTFAVQPGSLFPAFRRLEREGHLTSEWRATENNRRAKYYRLTAAGRRQLADQTANWETFVTAMSRVLRSTAPQSA
jgi:PadR family transcriptional regulator PadR